MAVHAAPCPPISKQVVSTTLRVPDTAYFPNGFACITQSLMPQIYTKVLPTTPRVSGTSLQNSCARDTQYPAPSTSNKFAPVTPIFLDTTDTGTDVNTVAIELDTTRDCDGVKHEHQ